MRILAVDDDVVSLELIVSILEKNNYEVVTAVSGKEAVTVLEAGERVDIIVTDVMMPVMDGFHLLTYLRADVRLRRIPVILCTALNDFESVRKGMELGAIDYITKPVNAETLAAKVKRAEKRVPGAILIVDDEELLLGLLSKILVRDGFRVITATSGTEVLELLEENDVALILSDIVMPGMDGMELLVTVKERYALLPVLLMTGHDIDLDKEQVLAAGADGYITKPFRNTEITARVRSFF